MRKILALTLISAVLLGLTGATWAAGGPPASLPQPARERVQQFRKAMDEFRGGLQAMKQNRINIASTQTEIREVAVAIREEMQRIRDAGLPFDESELDAIKIMTLNLRGIGKSIAGTMGQVSEQRRLVNRARAALEYGPAIRALNRIQEIQGSRLIDLDQAKATLQQVLNRLKAIQ